jgi:hypothetical protein
MDVKAGGSARYFVRASAGATVRRWLVSRLEVRSFAFRIMLDLSENNPSNFPRPRYDRILEAKSVSEHHSWNEGISSKAFLNNFG